MAEKYIKASECEKYFYEHLDDLHMIVAMNAINEILKVDVVEVVRCKDCKYAHYWYGNDDLRNTAYICDMFDTKMYFDDFCSRGEKRNSETT